MAGGKLAGQSGATDSDGPRHRPAAGSLAASGGGRDGESPELDEAMAETRVLLQHVARQGTKIDPKLVSTLVESQRIHRTPDWTGEAETDFWMSFNRLARAIQPVTVKSLRAAHTPRHAGSSGLRWLPLSQQSDARKSVNFYRLLTFAALVSLVALQVQWFMGYEIVRDLNVAGATESFISWKTIMTEMDDYECKLWSEQDEDPSCASLRDREKSAWADFEKSQLPVAAERDLLHRWNERYRWFYGEAPTGRAGDEDGLASTTEIAELVARLRTMVEGSSEEQAMQQAIVSIGRQLDALLGDDCKDLVFAQLAKCRERQLSSLAAEVQKADFVLGTLSDYILPLLYGLLGACAYVLRALSNDVRAMSFSRESKIGYGLRLQLGALAGLAIGWFLSPDDASAGVLQTSSPWALAFLAGYSVEILFAQLDRVIFAFTETSKDDAAPAQK